MISDAVTRSNNNPNDPRNRTVIHPVDDIYSANLETPINSSGLTKAFLNNLPAYRQGISVFRRGLEVGMAHGYWILGPFTVLGPLRDTSIANLAGLLSTIGLLIISTLIISLYGGSNPPAPTLTLTTPRPPEEFKTSEGWNEYGGGFLIGGVGGAIAAYFLLSNFSVIKELINR
ncbi:photosystem I reaction center protein subunit XI [Phormidium sp. CLA17]|uniref:photosystem I reaction center subunit XI n=1 Tax=Leptolyngbya sp. Cla-17 TaxID=2803751 RepID=UPI0018D83052|nr:photosystem I reaction center subunit XI [Leptolyngbya sp. Cla-17]MBM0742361.1 photosystem I reaction center protein subunit XI [Leptolyngbya sp. Cla-17]